MARSIDEPVKPTRGFVPARNDEERFLMRHIEDLANVAQSRNIARYSSFLSDREQALAQAALNRIDTQCCHFDGGWPGAERKLLAIEPDACYSASPLRCVRLTCFAQTEARMPEHRDYLGSLMGLEIRREALGDIVLMPDLPGVAYVFALETAAELICAELRSVGRTEVSAELISLDELPEFAQTQREMRMATVSSLRLDAVLAAMLRCSRGASSELIASGRVEINHLQAASSHEPVYEGDVFTVRGKGKFAIAALPGKSKKDRQIIEFYQY